MQIAKCSFINLNYKYDKANSTPTNRQASFCAAGYPIKGSVAAQLSLGDAMKAVANARILNSKEANGHLNLIGQVLDAMLSKMIGDPQSQTVYAISKQAKTGIADSTKLPMLSASPEAPIIQDSLLKTIEGIYAEKNFAFNDSNMILRQVSIILNDIADRTYEPQGAKQIHNLSDGLRTIVEKRSCF